VPFSAQTGEGRDELASALMSLLAMPDWKMPESDEAAEPAETVEE
jgi:GTP-binding protein